MTVLNRWVAALMLLAACIALSTCATGQSDPRVQSLTSGAYVFSESWQIPESGWRPMGLPFHDFFKPITPENKKLKTLWVKFAFDGKDAQALVTDYTSERYTAYLNGVAIFSNYVDPTEQNFASFKPAEIKFPKQLLKSGRNEIAVRLESDTFWCLGIGNVKIGPAAAIRASYDRSYYLQFMGPQIVNGIVVALTICIVLFWFKRRQEKAFFWLGLVGIAWWLRNLHYSAINPVIGPAAMWEIAISGIFVLATVFFGFAATFLDVPNRRRWLIVSGLVGGVLVVFRWALIANGQSDWPSHALTIPFTATLIIVFCRSCYRQPTTENMIMLGALTITISFTLHDFGFLGNAWRGAGFQIQPYACLIVYPAFLFAVGRRVLSSFSTVEHQNVELEHRIQLVTAELHQSEAVRRSLEIDHAIEQERERMMMEIHDRIGSSLISAVAVAERRGDPPDAIRTLKNSLTDLRIAVDSLEPIEGDLALVLGNFRHRIEREVLAAGLRFDWHVDEVPPLDWLDATNALHIMRTLQEAIGNILAHANASIIGVSCHQLTRNGRDGIVIRITDNGIGFVSIVPESGRGILNMQSRIESLQGEFRIESISGKGTSIEMWFPSLRASVADDL